MYAKCAMKDCMNPAEWTIGTWQCCDKCATSHVVEIEKGWGVSQWGTSSRIGQEAILKHNQTYNLNHFIVES